MKLIVEMEMPRHCNECDFFYGGNCFAIKDQDGVLPFDTLIDRPSWCPIIGGALPEQHGRLVDADSVALAMLEKGQGSSRYKLGEIWELNWLEIREALQTVPTIVSATERSET